MEPVCFWPVVRAGMLRTECEIQPGTTDSVLRVVIRVLLGHIMCGPCWATSCVGGAWQEEKGGGF